MNFLIWLLVGAAAGWAAGEIVQGFGFGILGNIVVGIIGAFVGGFAFNALGIALGSGIVGSFITATIGAVVFLLAVALIRKPVA